MLKKSNVSLYSSFLSNTVRICPSKASVVRICAHTCRWYGFQSIHNLSHYLMRLLVTLKCPVSSKSCLHVNTAVIDSTQQKEVATP